MHERLEGLSTSMRAEASVLQFVIITRRLILVTYVLPGIVMRVKTCLVTNLGQDRKSEQHCHGCRGC